MCSHCRRTVAGSHSGAGSGRSGREGSLAGDDRRDSSIVVVARRGSLWLSGESLPCGVASLDPRGGGAGGGPLLALLARAHHDRRGGWVGAIGLRRASIGRRVPWPAPQTQRAASSPRGRSRGGGAPLWHPHGRCAATEAAALSRRGVSVGAGVSAALRPAVRKRQKVSACCGAWHDGDRAGGAWPTGIADTTVRPVQVSVLRQPAPTAHTEIRCSILHLQVEVSV